MGNTNVSALAHQQDQRFHTFPARSAPIYGVAVHQTGSSTVEAALKAGANPLEYLADYYLKPDSYSAHYVIGWDGEIVQVVPDDEKAEHIGFLPVDRQAFLDGSWVTHLPASVVALWRAKWPAFKSPAHLFPGPSPNNVFVGMELIPIVDGAGVQPLEPGMLFTQEQHDAAVELAADIAARAQLPTGWQLGNRLLCHEDVNPLQRTNSHGGWDPGALREQPWFDMTYMRTHITASFSPNVA
jgi:N-acetyl-anhydromuramyl-L-alanine amidase AmpD